MPTLAHATPRTDASHITDLELTELYNQLDAARERVRALEARPSRPAIGALADRDRSRRDFLCLNYAYPGADVEEDRNQNRCIR